MQPFYWWASDFVAKDSATTLAWAKMVAPDVVEPPDDPIKARDFYRDHALVVTQA